MSESSGEQFEIAFGDQRVTVVEIGGGLRSYSAGGRELLDSYAPDEPIPSGRGQLLMPWPNRLEDGAYEFDGRSHQLPLTEPERRNAIHGLVRSEAWTAAAREPHRVVMEHVLEPRPGYPFTLSLSVEYSLSEGGLRVQTTATNVGAEPCPFGSGQHPYLTLGTPVVDSLVLRAPGRTVLIEDERGIPRGREPVEGTAYDFRRPREIGETDARRRVHRPGAGGGWTRARRAAGPGESRGSDGLARRELPLRAALHGRPASRRPAPEHRRRADDLPRQRLQDRGGPRPARARGKLRQRLGDRSGMSSLGRDPRTRESMPTVMR